MIYEIIILVSLAAIIILFLRKLPKHEQSGLDGNSRAIDENFPATLLGKADSCFHHKEFKKAETFYCQAAIEQPKNPKIYHRLGEIYLSWQNYKDAKDAFQTALDIENDKAINYFNLGKAYLGLRDAKNADNAFKKALDLEPKNKIFQKMRKK